MEEIDRLLSTLQVNKTCAVGIGTDATHDTDVEDDCLTMKNTQQQQCQQRYHRHLHATARVHRSRPECAD